MDINNRFKIIDELISADSKSPLRGQLENIELIAKGGMSEIYRAYQPALNRYVAIKKLKEELKHNSEVFERFRREAKALATVLHQNVAHVYDFVESTEEAYLLMEYIDGLDLSTIVTKVGSLPAHIAAAIMLGVTNGVAGIHGHRLIHRDIKPSNIRITSRGQVKLMDFGIILKTDAQALTRPGIMVGSPCYLSPEQVLGDTITPRSDIFAIGICFYEILTGSRPFRDEGEETVFQRIRKGAYIPVRQMNSKVPTTLERIVEKCLKTDPKERYANIKDLIMDIEKQLGVIQSARKEELVLHFLDEEALVEPSIPYTDIPKTRVGLRKWLTGPVLAAAGLLAALSFYFGAHYGHLIF